MDFAKLLIVFSLTNFVVFVLAFLTPGGYIVFGNIGSSPQFALVKTSILVALAVSVVAKIIEIYKIKLTMLTSFVIFLCVNVFFLYVFARTEISETVAVGIQGFFVAIVVGLILNLAQYTTWKTFLVKKKK